MLCQKLNFGDREIPLKIDIPESFQIQYLKEGFIDKYGLWHSNFKGMANRIEKTVIFMRKRIQVLFSVPSPFMFDVTSKFCLFFSSIHSSVFVHAKCLIFCSSAHLVFVKSSFVFLCFKVFLFFQFLSPSTFYCFISKFILIFSIIVLKFCSIGLCFFGFS